MKIQNIQPNSQDLKELEHYLKLIDDTLEKLNQKKIETLIKINQVKQNLIKSSDEARNF
jgi:hypothetical protein